MPPRLDALPKGHHLPPSAFELSPQWVREYAAAVEDEAIGALDGSLVPPMAVAALAVRSLLEAAKLPPGAIHLGQEMSLLEPVRVGERLAVQAPAGSARAGASWASISTSRAGTADRPCKAGRCSRCRRAQGESRDMTMNVGAELAAAVKEITQEKINRYAQAGGDGNPLPTHPELAAQTMFGGTIAHGMLILAYLSEMMTAAFGEDWLSGGRLKVRVKAPSRPGH